MCKKVPGIVEEKEFQTFDRLATLFFDT
jgi:chloride channel 7